MLVKVKDISELHNGMFVITPLNLIGIVVKVKSVTGHVDPFERIHLKYQHLNFQRQCDNMVVLQPTQLRYEKG